MTMQIYPRSIFNRIFIPFSVLSFTRLCLLQLIIAAIVAVNLAHSFQAQARMYPYSCKWVSKVSPSAIIFFSSTNGNGSYYGYLYYNGRRLLNIYEGNYQGYGSHWWSSSVDNHVNTYQLIEFWGNSPVRALPSNKLTSQRVKLLLVGLGSSLYYGIEHSWRNDTELFRAAEGFWIPGSGCRHHR